MSSELISHRTVGGGDRDLAVCGMEEVAADAEGAPALHLPPEAAT